MTENETKNVLDNIWDFAILADDESGEILEKAIDIASLALEEIQQVKEIISSFPLDCGSTVEDIREIYRQLRGFLQIGTMEELQALKDNERKCEECAGCTNWLCDCANIRDKAINDFKERLEKIIKSMQIAELEGKDMCPCHESGEPCRYMNQDIGCQYCAREQMIKDIDKISEEMRGAK